MYKPFQLQNRLLVGHHVKHDLGVLKIRHPKRQTIDTAFYKPVKRLAGIRGSGPVGLKRLTEQLLGKIFKMNSTNVHLDVQCNTV